MDTTIPEGYCQCGCGERTGVWQNSSLYRGRIKGKHKLYIQGHNQRQSRVDYVEEDRGHDTPCWIWKRGLDAAGYGQVNIYREGIWTTAKAHRLEYEKAYGPIPEGLPLDHLCRQPACCNPNHVEPVTPAENFQRGSGTKLNWEQVRAIRLAWNWQGVSPIVLAKQYGVTRTAISDIVHGRCWRE